ncbi:MAG: hypothetical protein HXS54_16120 [Theionarchaea archaeon]|nr:hypothetical protein [Theionarchaea archaeon]
MAKRRPKLLSDSLTQRTGQLKIKVEHAKKELLGFRNAFLNVISVFSSAFLSVFFAFAIDRPIKTCWIFLFVMVSVAYISGVYFLDIYLSRKVIPS